MKIILPLLLLSSFSFAQEELSTPANGYQESQKQKIEQSTQTIKSAETHFLQKQFYIGYAHESWSYNETDSSNNTKLMQDSGSLKGFVTRYHNTYKRFEYYGQLKYVSGDTTYDGSLINIYTDEISPHSSPSKNSIRTFDSRLRYIGLSNATYLLSFGLGFQHRLLKNPELAENPYDYTREATYTSFPLSVSGQVNISSKIAMGLEFDYFTFFNGETKSIKGFADESRNYEQNSGSGYRLTGNIDYTWKKTQLRLTPYFEYWNIKDSKLVLSPSTGYYFLEPENSTKTLGFNISVGI